MMGRRPHNLTISEQCRIVGYYQNGWPIEKLAQVYNIHYSTLYLILKKYGVKAIRKGHLSDEQKKEAITLYQKGMTITAVGKQLEVGKHSVRRLIKKEGLTRPQRVYQYDDEVFDKITEESAYWIGFLMADGYVRTGRYQFRLAVKLQTRDEEHLNKFRKFLKTDKPLYYEKYMANIMGQNGGELREYSSVSFCCDSERMVKNLRQYGIVPRKSTKEKVVGLEDNKDFWRGVIDGDGSFGIVNTTRAVQLSLVGSRDLVNQFGDFAKTVVNCSMIPTFEKRTQNTYRVKTSGWGNTPTLVDALYGGASTYLDRKYEIYKEIMRERARRSQ